MHANLLRFDKSKEICFIDCETENLCLYLPQNLPWQVSMLKVKGDAIIDEADFYVKWHRPPNVSEGAAIVTRFNPDNITNHGVDYRKVVKQCVQWTKEADYIAGHNVLGFDLQLLMQFYDMEGESTEGLAEKVIDTHALAKGLKIGEFFDKSKTSLVEYQYRMISTIAKGIKTRMSVLGQEYGIEHDYETLHNSLSDLGLNVKIWNKLKWQVEL